MVFNLHYFAINQVLQSFLRKGMITPVSTTIEYLIRLISVKESGGTNNRQTM
jgi:hypothetical protein